MVRITGRFQSSGDLRERPSHFGTINSVFLEIGLGISLPGQFNRAKTSRCRQTGGNRWWKNVFRSYGNRSSDIAFGLVVKALDIVLVGLSVFRVGVQIFRVGRGSEQGRFVLLTGLPIETELASRRGAPGKRHALGHRTGFEVRRLGERLFGTEGNQVRPLRIPPLGIRYSYSDDQVFSDKPSNRRFGMYGTWFLMRLHVHAVGRIGPVTQIKSSARNRAHSQLHAADLFDGQAFGGQRGNGEVDFNPIAAFDSGQVRNAGGNVQGWIQGFADRSATSQDHTAEDA